MIRYAGDDPRREGKTMKIYIYDSGHVDLEAPINMTQAQFDIFAQFLEDNFHVDYIDKVEATKKAGTGEGDHKDWTLDDYLALLEPIDNLSLAAKMDRTEMGIRMKRGQFVFDFLAWMKKKGYSLPVNRAIIMEFFGEKEAI
jgi:hypothetical protein